MSQLLQLLNGLIRMVVITPILWIMSFIMYIAGGVIYWTTLFTSFWVNLVIVTWSILNGTTDIITGLDNIWSQPAVSYVGVLPVVAFILWWDSASARSSGTETSPIKIMKEDLRRLFYWIIGAK